jgi:hypothetical protein
MHSQFDGLRADLPSIIVHALGDTLRSRGERSLCCKSGSYLEGAGSSAPTHLLAVKTRFKRFISHPS